MSIKSTQRITRKRALEILLEEVPQLSNKALENFMDRLADCGESKVLSEFDNFIVSDFPEGENAKD